MPSVLLKASAVREQHEAAFKGIVRSFVRSFVLYRYGLKLRETRKRLGSETKSLHT